jgi:uncharacterized lipoprotein YmbA
MKPLRILPCILLAAGLCACAGSPPVRYFSLDDGRPTAFTSPTGVSVGIVHVDLPEVIDRPQLVLRSAGHRLQLSERDRWAEPLRRQVPRLLARDLGVALDSARVVALAMDAQEYAIDFKLAVDIQHLDVVSGQWVELDAVWRVEPRNGRAFFGRALVREALEETAAPDEYAAAIDAERSAFHAMAESIAAGIKDRLEVGNSTSADGDGCQSGRKASSVIRSDDGFVGAFHPAQP